MPKKKLLLLLPCQRSLPCSIVSGRENVGALEPLKFTDALSQPTRIRTDLSMTTTTIQVDFATTEACIVFQLNEAAHQSQTQIPRFTENAT